MIEDLLQRDQPEYNLVRILTQALAIKPFSYIRDMTLSGLSASPYFTSEQKLSIKIIALQMDSAPLEHQVNDILMSILYTSWDSDVESMGVLPLAPMQREGIIQVIMDVCRDVIYQEAQRLCSLAELSTQLPEGWYLSDPEPITYGYGYEYGYHGSTGEYGLHYDYGYWANDFFNAFNIFDSPNQ